MKPRTALSLLDAFDACAEIEVIIADITFETYLNSRNTRLLVERLIEIVGEAMNRAVRSEPGVESTIPDARAITGMRNRVAHGYDQIDHETVWLAATTEIPALQNEIKEHLRREGDWPGNRE